MPFEINSSQLFLTYPQCNLSKEDALDILQSLVTNIDKYCVAHELHANGDDHIHVYLKLSDAVRFRRPDCLDLVTVDKVYHGNYQGCRSAKNVLKYCTKKEDYISNMDVAAALGSKSNRRAIAEEIILKKRPLHEVVVDNPQLLFGYTRLKLDVTVYQEDTAPQKDDLPPFLPNPWGRVLPSFKNSKRRHYWIYSRTPNFGKTYHFAKPLAAEYRATIATGDFTYWTVDRHTQLVILDDYNTAKLKWDGINQLADGTFQFRLFQRGVVVLAKYLVVILSNQPIFELYPHMNTFIYERFYEIELK